MDSGFLEETEDSDGTLTISDVVVEYDELEEPETAAHEMWLGANWLNDQLDIERPDGGLTDKNQEVMVIEEEKQGGYIEIHHTHSEPIPTRINGIIPDTHCKIAGSESRMHSDRNIVHTIIWIVPESSVDTWEQPEPSFDQYESFDKAEQDDVGVGELGQSNSTSTSDDTSSSTSSSVGSDSSRSHSSPERPTMLARGFMMMAFAGVQQAFMPLFFSLAVPASGQSTVLDSAMNTMNSMIDVLSVVMMFSGVAYIVLGMLK